MAPASRKNFIDSINHRQPDRVVVDFGSTAVTGIHVIVVEKLRNYYGLEKRPVKVIEPFQMLGEIDEELLKAMDIDVVGLYGENNMFGIPNRDWKPDRTFWGQEVLLPGTFNYSYNNNGDMLIHPEGDLSVPPSAMMPKTGFFFDAVERQEPLDETNLKADYNLEEFTRITNHDLAYWKAQAEAVATTGKGVMASLGGTALGDIALVPGLNLKHPKGIRGVAEWYVSTLIREDLIREIYDRETDIAVGNLQKINDAVGHMIDTVFICGTDFGTQNSTFCSPETYERVWLPYYKKVNDWIHLNTSWKTFKHSCGAVEPFMELFIKSGFDIINPVQINAANMDPGELKKKYGDRLVFWGGGVDTQKTLPFGTAAEVREEVLRRCEVFAANGGFVFNSIHNAQAGTPLENIVAMFNAVREFNCVL